MYGNIGNLISNNIIAIQHITAATGISSYFCTGNDPGINQGTVGGWLRFQDGSFLYHEHFHDRVLV